MMFEDRMKRIRNQNGVATTDPSPERSWGLRHVDRSVDDAHTEHLWRTYLARAQRAEKALSGKGSGKT